MCRWVICNLLLATAAAIFMVVPFGVRATSRPEREQTPLIEQFLSTPDAMPTSYRGVRHMTADNEHFHASAWMDVWTEADGSSFRYRVLDEGGSSYIRSHVFRAALESEQDFWRSGALGRSAFTTDNYEFEEGREIGGLRALVVKARRHDLLLIDGEIFVRPSDAELMRSEGRPSKSPSFWIRRIHVVRWYRRIAGTALPTRLESAADILIAGHSTFDVTYTYESVNGEPVEP
jgi:hypothetical protein